ncbi:MAG: hypothetical protein ACI89X_003916 [Planctomycetota bacterium]|jgi:hypothetical protein
MLARSKFAALLLLAAASVPATLSAQDAPRHIHIIGASVSGGFEDGPLTGAKTKGDSVSMLHILKKWSDGEVKVTSHSVMDMWFLFQDPIKKGQKQVQLAKRKKADLVVAIDFPFWFGYGYVRGEKSKARMARLETGLGYLKELNVPIIIGDFPNMKGAKIRMLNPRQIPTEATLKLLNARLKKFAADNKNVTLVAMAQIVKALKVDGVMLPLKDGELKTGPGALLQEDQLHATRLGMALMTFQMQETLRAHFPKKHPMHEQKWSFEEFADAAGADLELENLIDDAKQKK